MGLMYLFIIKYLRLITYQTVLGLKVRRSSELLSPEKTNTFHTNIYFVKSKLLHGNKQNKPGIFCTEAAYLKLL